MYTHTKETQVMQCLQALLQKLCQKEELAGIGLRS